jgi:hypothetical protein
MPAATNARTKAIQLPAMANAEVAAHVIDKTASVKLAMRDDDTCRWRKLLRLVWVRKQR